ncbi:hypothetical protein FGADI_5224 [Fusarium gaditjirri]|uniref:Apoptosis regulator Bcl-2 family BH4 domain-containing protein n=1 Tax=Fusarium gaditjirri TaxID=282569 RepID=A0A8H4TAV4_9HYPO|nr:hypothetical protein FGADI_5224 [Fusarium gaditjirri]
MELIDVGGTESQGPWKQLQALVRNKIKLNKAIDELSKVFLATKKQANDDTLSSFSLHDSICQWRLATMEDQDVWIIQATYCLSKHILSLDEKSHIFKFFTLINRCLHLLWKHIDTCHIDISGKFAEAYFTICLCGADVYLAMGKSEIARTLFTSAIDYIRSSSLSDPDDKVLLQLLCGLARSCENTGELEMAEEALLSASTISERLNGQMNEKTVSLVSRLKGVRDHMLTELKNRTRALVASTGPKLTPVMDSNSEVSLEFENEELHFQMIERIYAKSCLVPTLRSYSFSTMATLPNMAWELRFSHPILVFSSQGDENDLSRLPDVFPITIRGTANIMAYENIDIRSIHIDIFIHGMSAWKVEDQRKGKQQFGDDADFTRWKLKLCDPSIASDERFGDSCSFRLDNENSQENTRQPESDCVTKPDHISFPSGSYSYPFESTVDCSLHNAEKPFHGDTNWTILLVMEFPDPKPPIALVVELPVIQLPGQLRERRNTTRLSRQQSEGIPFYVDLPYEISRIGGRIPITVILGPVNADYRAEYLTYSIVQRRKQWTQDKTIQKTDEQKLVLGEIFSLEESSATTDDKTDGEETAFSYDSDEFLETFFANPLFPKIYLPNLDPDEPVFVSHDLMLPTCKQMETGSLVTVGGSRLDSEQSESRILETTQEIPITIVDCRITHRSDLLVDSIAHETSPANNRKTVCGCPDADIYEECFVRDKTPPKNRPINAILLTEKSLYTREIYGGSKEDVQHKNERLEEVWSEPIQAPSKPQHWEVVRGRPRNSSISENSVDDQTSDLHTTEGTPERYGFTADHRDEPPPYRG